MKTLLQRLWILVLASALLPCSVGVTTVAAAELVLIEHRRCPACARFNASVGRKYAATPQGQEAPLRRIKIGETKIPKYLAKKKIRGTPTFILMDNRREIGRFDGFSGSKRFWGRLDSLLRKLP